MNDRTPQRHSHPTRVRASAGFRWVCAALLLVGCGKPWAPVPPPVPPPVPASDPALLPMQYADHNIIFVSFDALQAAHLGCLGNPRPVTPTLDALAGRSFSFRHHYSVASWTVPASMTWFTGVYPSEHRMTNKFAIYNDRQQKTANLQELAPHIVTLAEVLHQRGYATGGFTGNAGVSGGFGYEQGFDVYYHEKNKFGGFEQSIAQAVSWLRKHRNQKFFLFLHGYDVHGQYLPAAGYDYRFVDRHYDKRYTGSPQEQEVLREEGLDRGALKLRDADVRFWRAIYDEKIARADRLFQSFLAELEELQLMDKTLLVVTSDHGTELYEHRRFDHGFTLYDEQIHVPIFIKLPDQSAGQSIDDRISSIDILPTILDLLEIEPQTAVTQPLRGTSLVPALQGMRAERDVFSETDYREYTFKRSIITPDGWKLIYTLEDRSRELYSLRQDPAETTNLAALQPQLADELEHRLFAHFASIGHDLRSQRWERGFNPVYRFPTK